MAVNQLVGFLEARGTARITLEPLRPVPGHTHLLTARKGAARMMAVQIPAAGLALYSPIPNLDDDALAAATGLGGVAAIIAPSPFAEVEFMAPPWW